MRALHTTAAIHKLPICRYPSLLSVKPQSYRKYRGSNSNSLWKIATESKPTTIIASSMGFTASNDKTQIKKPFSVLFVCLGNICRSPAAEGVFTHLVKGKGLDSKFNVDSAGTINYHEGDQADPRMRAASKRRGIEITSISRPIRPSDFRDFDLILAMDRINREDLLDAFERWRHKEPLPADADKKFELSAVQNSTYIFSSRAVQVGTNYWVFHYLESLTMFELKTSVSISGFLWEETPRVYTSTGESGGAVGRQA